jgi:hypothetical protein
MMYWSVQRAAPTKAMVRSRQVACVAVMMEDGMPPVIKGRLNVQTERMDNSFVCGLRASGRPSHAAIALIMVFSAPYVPDVTSQNLLQPVRPVLHARLRLVLREILPLRIPRALHHREVPVPDLRVVRVMPRALVRVDLRAVIRCFVVQMEPGNAGTKIRSVLQVAVVVEDLRSRVHTMPLRRRQAV